MAIDQNISPITALPGLLSSERPAAVDNLVEIELPLFSTQLPLWQNQLNSTQENINQKESEAKSAANVANSAVGLSQQYANSAEASKNSAKAIKEEIEELINDTVIPIGEAWSVAKSEQVQDDNELEEFLNFKF